MQCPLQEMSPQESAADVLPRLRARALADRAVFEKGVRAFVSHVQAYAKHECSLIFRLKGERGVSTFRVQGLHKSETACPVKASGTCQP